MQTVMDTHQSGFWSVRQTCQLRKSHSTLGSAPEDMWRAQHRAQCRYTHGYPACTASMYATLRRTGNVVNACLRYVSAHTHLQLPRPDVCRRVIDEGAGKVTLDATDEVVVLCMGALASRHRTAAVSGELMTGPEERLTR